MEETPMYTVTFKNEAGVEAISRYFETKKAAQKWIKWLSVQSFTTETSLYRGNAGEELLERSAA
jgi:hypothetical protein